MRFEWDETKNRTNQRDHDGIDFHLASHVLEDENLLIESDRVEDGEERMHAIGRVSALVLVVVHVVKETQHGEEIIRIVSARAATKREVRRYFEQTSQ